MAKKGNSRVTGDRPARIRVVQVLANPDGNRAERRAAAKVARMNPGKAAMLPRAPQAPAPGPWVARSRGRNGASG